MASLCVAVNVFPFCFSLYLNRDLACVMWRGWVCNWSDHMDVPLIVWCVIIDEIRADRLCTVPHGAPHADAVHLLSHHDKCTYHVAAMCTGCACITLHLHQYCLVMVACTCCAYLIDFDWDQHAAHCTSWWNSYMKWWDLWTGTYHMHMLCTYCMDQLRSLMTSDWLWWWSAYRMDWLCSSDWFWWTLAYCMLHIMMELIYRVMGSMNRNVPHAYAMHIPHGWAVLSDDIKIANVCHAYK